MHRRPMMRAVLAIATLATVFCSGARAQEWRDGTTDVHALFRAVGNLYGLDPDLLEAIASVESGDNADAVSPKGAQGLMQLMPATARRFRVHDSFDPVENVLGAARFIEHLRRSLAASPDIPLHLPELLAAYNAGEGVVTEYRGVPPYPETREYVRRVLLNYLTAGAPPELKANLAGLPALTASASPALPRPVEKPPDPLQQMAEIRDQRAAALRLSSSRSPAERTK
jgi:hypothetical protein